jgi:hypothetical protein
VHHHGAEEGPGLSCLTSLIGDCIRLELEQLREERRGMLGALWRADQVLEALGTPADSPTRQAIRTALAGRLPSA